MTEVLEEKFNNRMSVVLCWWNSRRERQS